MSSLEAIFKGGFVPFSDTATVDPEVEFLGVLNGSGLEVEYLAYNKLERVRTSDDKRGEKSGWYIFYPDGVAAGAWGDWRSGETNTWCAKRSHDMTPLEWQENKRRMEAAAKERAAEIERQQKAAAIEAKDILAVAQVATSSHPYLTRKGVKAHGVYIHEGNLIVPAINEHGEVSTIQTIYPDGKKRFLKGGKKSGAYFWIDGSQDTIYICEGYATGATIHEATGAAVAVAFDAGNLPKVAPIIRSRFLTAKIVLAADNDQFKGNENAGVKCANQAAELIGASVVVPQFADLASRPTDFNDLAALEGRDRTRQQLTGSTLPKAAASRFELSRVDSLEINEIDWLVEGYLESDSLDLIFGEPGCGKSFISIDMGCCVATGTPWHGHTVKQGMVIYIAGEGHNGLARRFKAWERINGRSLAGAPIYKSHRAAQLYDQASAVDVAEAVREIAEAEGQTPRLIIIDTVARNMGGDENSTQDMNQFIEHLDVLLRHPYKAAILCIHHSGKALPGQARGSTALRGALDAEYQVEMDHSTAMISLVNRKMKDGEVPPEKRFSIRQTGLGVMDSQGNEIQGAALEAVDISGLVEQAREMAVSLTKNQRTAIKALEGLFYRQRMDGDEVPITFDDWREAAIANGVARNRFYEAKDALVAKGKVLVSSTGVVSLTYDLVTEGE